MKAEEISLSQYSFKFDRVLGEPIELPYKLDDIRIPQNEIAYSGTINEVYSKLQTNVMYIYSLCRMSDNNIPQNYYRIGGGAPTGLLAVSGRMAWFNTDNVTSNQLKPLSTYGISQVDKLVDGRFYKENLLANKEIGFFISNTHLVVLTADFANDTLGAYVSTNAVTENSVFTFQNLNSIAFDKQNFIYVSDNFLNTIYKYNIENLVLEDNIIGKKILYVDSVGGTGNYLDNDRFNNPCFLNIYNDLLYVIDKNNFCVKVYDLNLNYKTTIRSKRIFQQNNVTAFRPNLNNNLFYMGFEDKFAVFTPDLLPPPPPEPLFVGDDRQKQLPDVDVSDVTYYTLSSLFTSGERILDFSFSEADKNIFYIVSNKGVYKRFISKPAYHIGRFLLTEQNLFLSAFKFSMIDNYDQDTDRLIIYGINQNAGIFYEFLEDSNYISILTNDDIDLYTYDEIKINPDEYSQDWVFTKANYKLLLNILTVRDRIVKRFAGKYDYNGNLLYFGPLYLTDNEVQKDLFGVSLNYFINVNEVFSNSVFNRSIDKFYSFQTHMLSVLKDAYLNVYPPLSTTIIVS